LAHDELALADMNSPPSGYNVTYPDSMGRNRHNRNGLARQRDELDLVSGSIRMDHHNPANVSGFQPFFGPALRQYDGIKFLDHC